MNSIFLKRFFLAVLILANFSTAVFSQSEAELKRRIISNAELDGESVEELMAGDEDKDEKPSKNKKERRLPSTFARDVPYTPAMTALMEAYYNHKITSDELRRRYYDNAVAAAENRGDEYAKYVDLARADFFYGASIMETFDLTAIDDINLTDTSSGSDVDADAGIYFDRSIENARAALNIRKGDDAYAILSHAISSNCAAKTTSYVLANALKVRSNAKRAIKIEYSNGMAHFLAIAQDVYAPWPISKINSGRKKMIKLLDDKYIRVEKYDRLLIYSAVGYSYLRQKKWKNAIEWYNKVLEICPQNYSAKLMIGKAERKNMKK